MAEMAGTGDKYSQSAVRGHLLTAEVDRSRAITLGEPIRPDHRVFWLDIAVVNPCAWAARAPSRSVAPHAALTDRVGRPAQLPQETPPTSSITIASRDEEWITS